ncbi:MAG: 5'-nucleotidase C-terminal domain-containing protein, partial [Dinoroseobacter sp.]|nr:5'-nucleotidase C-terminal domain-containing protein [Dinoroseobacter sp.]
ALLEGQIETRDIRESAQTYIPELRADGADLVIALCHSGFGALDPPVGAENAALGLAADGGIDALVAGHAHQIFPSEDFAGHVGLDVSAGTAQGVPTVMGGANGSQLGVIDLWLEQTPSRWRVQRSASEIRHIAERERTGATVGRVGCDPAVKADALETHRATLAYMERPIGHLAAPLTSFFAMVAPCPCAALIAKAQRWFIERQLFGTAYANLPILSAAASFKTGGRSGPDHFTDISAGELSWRHAADIYPFPNRLCALTVTGADLQEWLERAASIFKRIEQNETDRELLDPVFAPYNFDQVFGLSYTIDLSQPARFNPDGTLRRSQAKRITSLRHANRPVRHDDTFVIVTNDYRANGGGNFPGTGADRVIHTSPNLNRDILIAYIAEVGTVQAIEDRAWTFAKVPGASALLDTSPLASAHLNRVAHLEPQMLDPTARGFQKLRIALS